MKSKIYLLAISCFLAIPATLRGEETWTTEQLEFFENRVRPLLVKHCYSCHSSKAKKIQAGLRLDSRAQLLKGGDSGAAVVPKDPGKSLLIEAINYEANEMPPDSKLKKADIETLTQWVADGAAWPASDKVAAARKSGYDFAAWRNKHWAFQSVKRPGLPNIRKQAWTRSAVDYFVLSRLEAAGLQPSRTASRRQLIRRVYFDLLGLPPTPAAVDDFVRDKRPDAYERLVDKLLAAPAYGERWGRHWLDVARFSDGLGGFLDNAALPFAFQYRDWVVAAMNRDLPYDQFVTLQISGDLSPNFEDAAATGLFAIGPTYRSDGGDPDSVAQAKSETLDDRVNTLTRAFLGLTVACARCHDHKFDPIPTSDYYSLAGVFNNTNNIARPYATAEEVQRFNDMQATINSLQKQIKQRQGQQKKAALNEAQQAELARWLKDLEDLRKQLPAKYPMIHSLADKSSTDMKIALRGDLRKPGPVAPRRFLRIVAGEKAEHFKQGSGRQQLAAAVTDPANPLTARVIVNRVWLHHFGRALVRSPSNFGSLGEEPTHPLLLDWLADELVRSNWSLKRLHRTILTSATYRMSSDYHEKNYQADGDNRLLWRMNPRRLEVEAWRDALLTVTDELSRQQKGPPTDNILATNRRTLYTKISRNGDRFASDAFLRLFDFPTPRATNPKRTTSTVPQQYLFMMNSPFMISRSKAFAERLHGRHDDDKFRIAEAYRLLFGRDPRNRELEIGLAFLRKAGQQQPNVKLTAWQQYAQVLLSANEFIYVQ